MKKLLEVREMFLDFFKNEGHIIMKSSSLIPKSDSTLLFSNAGMNQFTDIFLGLDKTSVQKRVATSQHCMRLGGKHNDLENVGYTSHHHTYFEMLGNFSFGDYFKYDAIHFAWKLLTDSKWFGIEKSKLWITVHEEDKETYEIWRDKIKVPGNRIVSVKRKNEKDLGNFWTMGNTGPCGPCSEIFYDHGSHIVGDIPGSKKEGNRYVELWNLVFIQFNQIKDGTLVHLPKLSVDTGMGLERITAVLQGVSSNFEIDFFKNLIFFVAKNVGLENFYHNSLQVIVDHIRACIFLISFGVFPSNEGRGYVLRKIIRRAIRHGRILGYSGEFLYKLIPTFIEIMEENNTYKIFSKKDLIVDILKEEEEKFIFTLDNGLSLLLNEIKNLTCKKDTISGKFAFLLHDTYGFPLELTHEICKERNIRINMEEFESFMQKQRNLSKKNYIENFLINSKQDFSFQKYRTKFIGYKKLSSVSTIISIIKDNKLIDLFSFQKEKNLFILVLDITPFYGESGGQVGDRGKIESECGVFEVLDTKKVKNIIFHVGKMIYGAFSEKEKVFAKVNKHRRKKISINHSSIHLLHAALRCLLGNHVTQRGSLVEENFIRFDFSYNKPLNSSEIYDIETIVNQNIRENLFVHDEILNFSEIKKNKTIAIFQNKYEKDVRVINIGNVSSELCGGTHVNQTGDIGLFCIVSEHGKSSGVRRIEAKSGLSALEYIHNKDKILKEISLLYKCKIYSNLVDKVKKVQIKSIQLERIIKKFEQEKIKRESSLLVINEVRKIHDINVIIYQFNGVKCTTLNSISSYIVKYKLNSVVIILSSIFGDKTYLSIKVTKDLIKLITSKEILNFFLKRKGWKGGGNYEFSQAVGNENYLFSENFLKYIKNLFSKKI